MRIQLPSARSADRLVVAGAAVALVLGVLIALLGGYQYHRQVEQLTDDSARITAQTLARASVEPLLDGHPLGEGLTDAETARLRTAVAQTAARRIELRIYDFTGRPLLGPPARGTGEATDGPATSSSEAIRAVGEAASEGSSLRRAGGDVREVFVRLRAGDDRHPVGVLGVRLLDPPAPAATRPERRSLLLGFGSLYLLTCLVIAVAIRHLRRESRRTEALLKLDALTELPNRSTFRDLVTAEAASGRGLVTVAVIDINRFGAVNESLGQETGDQLLIDVTRRLTDQLGDGDVAARLNGDVFGVMLTSCRTAEAAVTRLTGLREAVERPVVLAGLPLQVEVLIGYELGEPGDPDPGTLLQRAEVAHRSAKAGQGAVVRYEAGQGTFDAESLALVGELRRAVRMGELRLHYQPKLRLKDNTIEGVEALLRWNHPRRGLLPPADFIPLAEYTSLMGLLTDWVLDAALAQLSDWGDEMAGMTMAVNVSARNLTEPSFAQRVGQVLRRYRIPPSRLVLEITESAAFVDPRTVRRVLADLDASGVQISLDDFGQGQTSLRYLSSLPLSELKIDREFVGDMVEVTSHAAIVRSVVDLSHRLDFTVVAEGVEDSAALSALEAMGCDAVQGFLLTVPLPGDQLLEWMRARRAASTAASPSLWDSMAGSPS